MARLATNASIRTADREHRPLRYRAPRRTLIEIEQARESRG